MKKLQCILCCLLCLTLLVFVGFRPVRASAATALMDIATNYQDVVQVAPYLIPIILVLIGMDWYYSNIDEIVAKAEEIYANGSTALRSWADDVAAQIIDGTSAFKISSGAREDINKKLGPNNQLDDDKKYILLPPDLLSLGALSSSDVLTADASQLLEENNALTGKTNSLLSRISTSLSDFSKVLLETIREQFSGIIERFNTFISAVSTRLDDVKSRLSTVNTSIGSGFRDVKDFIFTTRTVIADGFRDIEGFIVGTNTVIGDGFRDIKDFIIGTRTVIGDGFRDIKDFIVDSRAVIGDGFRDVKDWFFSISTTISQSFSNLQTSVASWFTSLGDRIEQLLNPSPVLPDTTVSDEVANQEGAIQDSIAIGFDEGNKFIGYAKDFFEEDLSAFLVVGLIFNEFAGIPIFNKLLIISCSIGLVGTLLGMALDIKSFTVTQRRREAAAQARARGRMERSRAA